MHVRQVEVDHVKLVERYRALEYLAVVQSIMSKALENVNQFACWVFKWQLS